MSLKEQYWRYSLVAIILLLGILIFFQILPFFSGILGAMTIYILLRNQMLYLTEKKRMKRSIMAILLLCETILCFLIPLSIVVWVFVNKLQAINLDPHSLIAPVALRNSIFFMIFSCVSQLILGLVLAALLTNIKKGRNLFKNIYYLPCVLSSAALGLMWMFVFTPKLGINQIMASLGLIKDCTEGPQWLFNTDGYIILPIIVISVVALWQYVGQSMMLYMAQISGISNDIYEAAYIDGATKTQAFTRITLPLIRPMVATAMSLNAIGSLKFFDLVYNMIPEGFLGNRAHVLATHLYDQAFKYNKLGYGSAIGVVLLVMCLVVTVFINKFVKVDNYEM